MRAVRLLLEAFGPWPFRHAESHCLFRFLLICSDSVFARYVCKSYSGMFISTRPGPQGFYRDRCQPVSQSVDCRVLDLGLLAFPYRLSGILWLLQGIKGRPWVMRWHF